ncbi:MAG: hypothetical protein CSB55_08445 [Candidatus Cloacimonadota bacterium]|nr:MAG: hypothetical protein CSB55_08445 [Candidatus Cloacimonadota bacterium]
MSFYRDQTESLFRSLNIDSRKLEEDLKAGLHSEGIEFIVNSGMTEVLAKFESALDYFCDESMERISYTDDKMLQVLLMSLHHLERFDDFKRVRESLKDKNKKIYDLYDGYEDFQKSDKQISGKFIKVRYDKRLENEVDFLLSDLDQVEMFLERYWDREQFPDIYVTLLYSSNGNNYNPYLKESFFSIGNFYASEHNKTKLSKMLIHDFVKLCNITNAEAVSGLRISEEDLPNFTFLDEGYALWQENEYEEIHSGAAFYAHNCAYHILKNNLIEFVRIGTEWMSFDLCKKYPVIQELGTSFIYFIIDRVSPLKVLNLFSKNSSDANLISWDEYVRFSLGKSFVELREEWRDFIFDKFKNETKSSYDILSYIRLEEETDEHYCFYYDSNSPVKGRNNVFVYDDQDKLLDVWDKFGRLMVEKKGKTEYLTFYVVYRNFSQIKKYEL